MSAINLIVLYVEDTEKSGAFYERLLGTRANVLSPGFTAFHMPGGLMLGMWSKATAKPEAQGGPGAMEVGIMISEDGGVAAFFERARCGASIGCPVSCRVD